MKDKPMLNGSEPAHVNWHEQRETVGVDAWTSWPEYFTGTDLLNDKEVKRDWWVEPLFPGDDLALLGGDGGIGKSTAAATLAVASVMGWEWFGYNVDQRRTLFVSCEDDRAELKIKWRPIIREAIERAGGGAEGANLIKSRLSELFVLDLSRSPKKRFARSDPKTAEVSPTDLFNEVCKHVLENGITAIIIDSLTHVWGEQTNEDSSQEFIALLRSLRIAIVLIGHPSKASKASGDNYFGAVCWNNGVRARCFMKEVGDGLIQFSLDKANRSKKGDKFLLRFNDDGQLVRVDYDGEDEDRTIRDHNARQRFLHLLALFARTGQEVSPKLKAGTYAPNAFEKHPENRDALERFTKAELERAFQQLLASGEIQIIEEGPDTKRRQRLRLAEEGSKQ